MLLRLGAGLSDHTLAPLKPVKAKHTTLRRKIDGQLAISVCHPASRVDCAP